MSNPTHCKIDSVKHCDNDNEDADNLETILSGGNNLADGNHSVKPPMFQMGVLRSNCIDCLDRTNVAQYAYGLASLGQQLRALGIKDSTKIDLDDPLSDELMRFYERMGDTLAHQYGGSAAHNKIFSERRGQCKAATQSQEFFRTLQRYYNNAYMDAEKQNAINVFLGHFQPQQGKPEVWELDSDQHYNAYRNGKANVDENGRSFFKRSLSDGNILSESNSRMSTLNIKKDFSNSVLSDRLQRRSKLLSESTPEISTCECNLTFSRKVQGSWTSLKDNKCLYTPSMPRRKLFVDMQGYRCFENDNGDAFDCSNFVDLDWLSSSGNSCEEELFEGSMFTNSPIARLSSDNVVNEMVEETTPSTCECGSSMKGREQTETEMSYDNAQNYEILEEFSDSFVHWVTYGETFCH